MRTSLASRAGSAAIYAAAVAMCAITGALTASGSSSDQVWLEAVARSLTVAATIGAGLLALHRPPFERFGTLLVIAGSVWFLTTLANAGDATLYSIGRIAQWAFEPLLIYCMLAFPTGRLESRLDRALVGATALAVLLLFLPTALLVEQYAVPAPVASCVAGCPANAFMVSGSEPAFVEDVVRPLRELVVTALLVAVAVRLALRIRTATHLVRRAVSPVLAVACFRCAAFAAAFVGRRFWPDSAVLDVSLWAIAVTVPLMALAFLAGLVRWWVFMARSTQRLAANLREHPTPEDLRCALAEAFDDPALEVVYWLGNGNGKGHWGDADGHAVAPPSAVQGRAVTEIVDEGRRVAAIVHDAALKDDHAFIDTASSYAVMTIENHRLSAQTASLLRAVRQSRSRIQAAADDERRRIERDLHDGAQQRLVALRIKLELAAEQTDAGRGNGAAGAAALRRLGDDVEDALDEVRSLARGIHPASLDRGLAAGLRAAALRNALPTRVLAAGIRRHSRDVESAAYFVCLEALQNATKHAAGATVAVIELSDGDALRLEVRDDGSGFDPAAAGGFGFTSMRDRLAAVSGDLAIISSPGHGTRVIGTIPLRAAPV
jgi:signal transduction histidine kinase